MGEGGVATTYLGERRARGEQRAALKEVHEDKWADPEFRAQFWAEVEALGNLRNGNIAGIIDFQPHLGRLVLELVDGVDLHRLHSALPDRRMPWDLVALILRELCHALGYAHRRRRGGEEAGVVHRDVKASNVLISYEGEVKLTDFGFARILKNSHPHSTVIRGTVGCLSPEQTRPNEVLDGRSDLFSLGVLLYELLTGHRPFDAPSEEDVIHATREGKRRPLSDYNIEGPQELFDIIEKLLATKREDRWQTAEAVLDQLEQLPTPHRRRELGRLARMALPPVTSRIDLERSAARWLAPSTLRRAPARGWLLAAVSAALVASMGSARMFSRATQAADDADPARAARNVAAPPTLTSTSTGGSVDFTTALPPSTAERPSLNAPSAALSTLGEPGARAPAPGPSSLSSTPPPSTPPTTPAPVAQADPPRIPGKPRSKHGAENVRVMVGSTPLPQVNIWIDGKPQGRGPADVWLKPGRHVFAAGRDKPEYTVTQTVLPDPGGNPLTVRIERKE